MYVVKIQYKDSEDIMYATDNILHSVKDLRKTNSVFSLDEFIMSLDKARKLVANLISRQGQVSDWGGSTTSFNYISIVELSNYEPNREYQVVDYREFK